MENEEKKFYQKDWFLWLWLILFPPVGIILLWTVQKDKKKETKIILSVVFAIWFIILMANTGGVSKEPTNTEPPAAEYSPPHQFASKEPANTESPASQQGQTNEQKPKTSTNSDFDKIDFSGPQDVRNDVTGNWRITLIAEAVKFENYALDYYNKYFESDEEIHAIVNFTYKTTTKISVMGNLLDVAVHEYVNKEEHDAKKLFSGMLLKEYHVNMDSGKIEEIQ